MPNGWSLEVSFLQSLSNRKVLILGAGITGRSVSRFLTESGSTSLMLDEVASPNSQNSITDLTLSDFDLAIVSPGWRHDHPWIVEVRKSGIELLSEVDLAWRIRCELNPQQRWLALTGTNGKTTTVQMAESMLQRSGIRARACGNVGDPVIDLVRDSDIDILVLELSSFQLSWSREARFFASAILNIADDHIDWHGSFAAYADAKFAVAEMSEMLIANLDDPVVESGVRELPIRIVPYTLNTPAPHQIGLVENLIVDRAFVSGDAEVLFELSDVTPSVPHNVANAMAAAGLARAVGANATSISAALADFRLDHHRLELILEHNGVSWIDDSKATNPHAALAALKSQMRAIWIAGGLAKDANMELLIKEGRSRIKYAILIGRDASVISDSLRKFAPDVLFEIVDSKLAGSELMREVVRIAKAKAESGDTVLLAPACASMDQFKNYSERGDLFAQAVKDLIDAQ